MLEKQYSVQFFTSLVESMQKVCREYLQFDQVVELSGYLSLEIDNTKKERYVVSELLHSSGNVISESYCTKAFKTVPSVAVAADAAKRKDSSSYEGLGEVSGRLEKQSTGEYSRQFSNQSFSGSGGQDASTALFGNKNHLKVNNSYHQNDVSQSPQDQFSYSSADWELSSLQCGTTDINRDVMQITPSISNSSDRLAGTTTKRKSVHLPTSRESKRGKISSGNEKSECLLSTTTTSSVLNNLDSHNEQPNSLFSTTSDSQSSLPNIKRESDSSMHFVQVEDVEDCVAGGGLTNLSNDQHFRGLAGTDSKSMNKNFQTNPATWEEANANSVELFKASKILDPEPEIAKKYASVKVNRNALVEAEIRAIHSRDPSSALLNLVIDLLFSPSELASSTGLGMKPRKRESEQQRPLDPVRVDAIREYTRLVCKKKGYQQLLAKELNRKFTNKCSHKRSRKSVQASQFNNTSV